MLQQSDFPVNFAGSFQELRTAGELFDVTLACEDQTVEAHKVIIAACSSFFRHVLLKTKQKHPFIYLKGVLHKDLLALLDYIYTGETKVVADDVNRFIEVANELKVKGLAEPENNSVDDYKLESETGSSLERTKNEEISLVKDELVVMSSTKEDISSGTISLSINGDEECNDEENTSFNYDQKARLKKEISKRIEKIISDDGKMWKCTECGKISKRRDNLGLHIETHLDGFSQTCMFCDKTYKTRGSMQMHISINHRIKK